MASKVRTYYIIIISVAIFGLFFTCEYITDRNIVILKKDIISKTYSGTVINKVSPNREGEDTHLEILINGNNKYLVSPIQSTLEKMNIGDSVYKPKNENFIYMYKEKGKQRLEYIYLNEKMKKELKNNYPELNLNK
ncbi:MAG: hypothetical protein ACTJGD_03860 [Mesonia hippocampi]|uniref:hypothetical protein n=1 Tax=Mesonia hippocampi TaxID=1628250 RepID=UPI003F96E51C